MTRTPDQPNRRTFLKQSAALTGAFVLGVQGSTFAAADGLGPEVTHWVVIHADDTVVIRIARSALGQGTVPGVAPRVAEERECAWSTVRPA
ncbi:MAG: twin-arginine translocation signal domain-containing protein, partial [bacterium]